MNRKVIPQNRGGRDVIHGGSRGNMALEDLISMDSKGEGIQGSVVNKVSSEISRQTLQEGNPKEEKRLMNSR